MFLDLRKYRVVDLSPQVVGAVRTLEGEELEGSPDPLGEMCYLTERVGGEGTDHTKGNAVRMSGHVGAHTEGGKGHIDHWEGYEKQTGLWEYPLEAFYGEAVVCDLSPLKPLSEEEAGGGPRRQFITPEHLRDVRKGDIVLLWSPYTNPAETPLMPPETADWLVETGIKMLGVQMPGVYFDSLEGNTHKRLLSNDIPIVYPLENLDTLKKNRVFYMGLPIKIARMEATWVRAIAIEEL